MKANMISYNDSRKKKQRAILAVSLYCVYSVKNYSRMAQMNILFCSFGFSVIRVF